MKICNMGTDGLMLICGSCGDELPQPHPPAYLLEIVRGRGYLESG